MRVVWIRSLAPSAAQPGGLGGQPQPRLWIHGLGIVTAIDSEPPRQQRRARRHPLGLIGQSRSPQQHPVGPIRTVRHHIDAVVNAVAHTHLEIPWLPDERFVA